MHSNPDSPRMPARRTYPPRIKAARLDDLPFVFQPGDVSQRSRHRQCARCHGELACHWHFPTPAAYGRACDIGYECCAHLAQFLKQQPRWRCHGLLRKILADIDFTDRSPNHGYSVGFLAYVERLFRCAALDLDVFADIDATHAYYEAMARRYAVDAKRMGRAQP